MESAKIQVWLDCDPGLDDIMAIILAAGEPRINLIGVSTSPGNSSIENTTRNALDILYNIGRSDVPVIMGAEKPFASNATYAGHIHGDNGLGGVTIPASDKKAIVADRFGEIYRRIMAAEGKVSFVNTGSLTNLAILLSSHPDLKDKLQEISIMGGAIGEGNITPAAEFNIYFDPIAAKETLSYGIPYTIVPLEVTHTVRANEKVLAKMGEFKSKVGQTLVKLIEIFKHNYFSIYKFEHPPIHDPCAVYYLLEREQFQSLPAYVVVDTYPTSAGRTNVNFHYERANHKPNCHVTRRINTEKFWQVMMEAYGKVVPRE